jgi:small subunit ribosomal protein S5
MSEEKVTKENKASDKTDKKAVPAAKKEEKTAAATPAKAGAKSVYAKKQQARKAKRGPRSDKTQDEFEQRIVDIARVTRVMAGGKRMRFRACVAIGNRKGKVGIGLDKGADVTIAVNKAVNQAKKNMVDVSIVNETIPHEIFHKLGAAKILLKPARKGKGVIAGGAIRIILELAGVHNITSKNLGTNNKVNVAKCTMSALASLKKVEVKKKEVKKTENSKQKTDKKDNKNIKK